MPRRRKAKTKYVVVNQRHGSQHGMFSSYNYSKAQSYFMKHPRAYGIQKYRGGVTAGLIQPSVPGKLRFKGKVYTRGYVGGHTKETANKLVRSFKKDGHSAFAKKTKHGYQVFVHVKG